METSKVLMNIFGNMKGNFEKTLNLSEQELNSMHLVCTYSSGRIVFKAKQRIREENSTRTTSHSSDIAENFDGLLDMHAFVPGEVDISFEICDVKDMKLVLTCK